VESLSSHLDQLDTMESLQLESYETEARNHVATHFSWDVVVDQLEDLYVRSVAAGKVTGAAPW
jgi:glycosyltransferase involved in cell wall biosynthesis